MFGLCQTGPHGCKPGHQAFASELSLPDPDTVEICFRICRSIGVQVGSEALPQLKEFRYLVVVVKGELTLKAKL